jgi:hypothetical protein
MSKNKTMDLGKELKKYRAGIDVSLADIFDMKSSPKLAGLAELLEALWASERDLDSVRCGTLHLLRDTKNGDNTTIAIRLRFKVPAL